MPSLTLSQRCWAQAVWGWNAPRTGQLLLVQVNTGETALNKGEVSQVFDMYTPCKLSCPLNAPEIRVQEFKKFQLSVWFLSPFTRKWQQTPVFLKYYSNNLLVYCCSEKGFWLNVHDPFFHIPANTDHDFMGALKKKKKTHLKGYSKSPHICWIIV